MANIIHFFSNYSLLTGNLCCGWSCLSFASPETRKLHVVFIFTCSRIFIYQAYPIFMHSLNEMLYNLKVINIDPKDASHLLVLNYILVGILVLIDFRISMKIYLKSLASMAKLKA